MTSAEPIWDSNAERAVLGSALLSPDALDRVADLLTPADFWQPSHAQLWACILQLRDTNRAADVVTCAAILGRSTTYVAAGGMNLLMSLTAIETAPSPLTIGEYAEIVADRAMRRRVVQAGLRIAQLGECAGSDATDVLAMVRREVEDATTTRGNGTLVPVAESAPEWLASLDHAPAGTVATPWPALDDLLGGGLRAGTVTYLAARTSVGKTLVATSIAAAAAYGRAKVDYWSLEMTRDELIARIVSNMATVPLRTLIRHELNLDEYTRAQSAVKQLAEWPLSIDDSSGVSVSRIRSQARTARSDLIVVDHLGLVKTDDPRARRNEQISGMSKQLKALAKELQVPVLVLHQLNRGATNRAEQRPELADLKESGAVEEDADTVILLWRPPDKKSEMCAIVAKQRNGPTGEVWLMVDGKHARVTPGDPYRG